MTKNPTVESLRDQLAACREECKRLRQENAMSRARLGLPPESADTPPRPETVKKTIDTTLSTADKIQLFRQLFRGREDVYPRRWKSKAGKTGYSPVCKHEWQRPLCRKPKVKCGDCEHRELLPVTDQVFFDHLAGRITAGVYPLRHDDTCFFLAVDFDKKSWQDDVRTFLATCRQHDLPAALERSRSGNGGHVWFFFEKALDAALARNFGCALLTETLAGRCQIGLDSYDRLLPSQDTLPENGFGNLIALPLQKNPRSEGNSIFLNENFEPYPDQWSYLASIARCTEEQVKEVVRNAASKNSILGIRKTSTDPDNQEDPWLTPPSGKRNEIPIKGPLPGKMVLVQANLIYIAKESVPPGLQDKLLRLAAFQNPEFYKAQAMRFSTWNKPRIIHCNEDFPDHIGLPRGCLADAVSLLEELGIHVKIKDERYKGKKINLSFHGTLRPEQKQAVTRISAHDTGILAATTAFGKTVVAAWLIAERKTNTLVLVHRRQLMDQWQKKLSLFLGIPEHNIGMIGGGKKKPTRTLDIGILQSLNRKGVVDDIVADYGQVIVDECHHLSAFSFEQTLKQVKARYVLGLTATLVRKDGHHPIILMQCGPVRFRMSARKAAADRPFNHILLPRFTELTLANPSPTIHDAYRAIMENEARNSQIVADVIAALQAGRTPLVLTERVAHLDILAELITQRSDCQPVILKGGQGVKKRKKLQDELDAKSDRPKVLLATGRYIGEGFDEPDLDTLFLAMPVSWKGVIQQYAGRLHRVNDIKKEVMVYDYVDSQVPLLMRMWEKRCKGYSAIGYSLKKDEREQD